MIGEIKKTTLPLLIYLIGIILIFSNISLCYGFDFGIAGAVKKDVQELVQKMENTVPKAPSGLMANVVSGSQINLAWQDNSSNELGFKIERKTEDGSYAQIADVGKNATSYSNTGLDSLIKY